MQRYFVTGYWRNNLGDDLFLQILCDRYPNFKFYTLMDKEYINEFSKISNLVIIKSNIFLRSINKFFKILNILPIQILLLPIFFKRYIEIGGSIFIQGKDWKFRLRQRQFLAKNIREYYIVGSNFGPYRLDAFINGYQNLFNRISGTVFRDKYSHNLFKIDQVSVAPDVIFNLSRGQKSETKKKQITISVIDVYKKAKGNRLKELQKQYEKKIRSISIYYASKGYSVVLMSFCDYEGDDNVITRICLDIPIKLKKFIRPYSHKNLSVSLNIVKESDKIIASRFHASILAFLFGIPVLPIAYSKKTEDVINDIFGEKKWQSINELIKIPLHNIDDYFVMVKEKSLNDLINESKNQFQFIDRYVRKNK